jgi:endonuclease/exonuclease/phosphatase family metal-dependent hydrolase
MTRNLFIGTGLEPLFGVSSPPDLLVALSQLWANVQATSFPQRAVALAAEIERTKPDVVGLQEAVLWRTQAPSDFMTTPATNVVHDFVETLLAELAKRGLRYRAVAVATNADVEFPVLYLGIDLRLTDRDAILVREGLPVTDPQVHRFAAALSLSNPAASITIPRSWESADVGIGGQVIRVVNTHLEGTDGTVQAAQAQELLSGLAGSPYPILLLGDFNSKADRTGTPSYGLIADGGYTDAWGAVHPGEPGFTCCQSTDLKSPTSMLDERIDIVFGRGLTPLSAEVVGDEPGDRTASGLWPSDHAGVVATWELPELDTEVLAELRGVAVTKSRAITAKLAVDEVVSLRLELRRKGKLLAARDIATLRPGLRTVRLAVPQTVGAGRAKLILLLEDEAGNVATLTGSVKLPASG